MDLGIIVIAVLSTILLAYIVSAIIDAAKKNR